MVTNWGIAGYTGSLLLPEAANETALQSGIVGASVSGPWILVSTFKDGLAAYTATTGQLAWTWNSFGSIYCFVRYKNGFLVGTAKGLVSMVDPWQHRYAALQNEELLHILPGEDSTVTAITASSATTFSETETLSSSDQWPEQDGAYVRNKTFHFRDASSPLPYRFVNGLAVIKDHAAISLAPGLTLLSHGAESRQILMEGVVHDLATDGRHFLAGTMTQGVHVVAPDGRVVGRIGSGRAAVSEVRPGKVALLFWDGSILDSDANQLGRITDGNPRDATMVRDRLAVLVTRPDRDPVIGLLQGDTWQPLEVPGLAEIGAEQIAANDTYLFAAGPRGVIRTRLPLASAAPPRPDWRWSVPVDGAAVTLPNATQEYVRLSVGPDELPPAPATYFRLRIGEGSWTDVQPGSALQIPLPWGRTPVVTQAERNGLQVESAFTLVRPWPWWLRAWAWPLHVAALSGIVFGFSRLRTRRLELRNRELERRVALRTDELRKASAAKEEFLAGISHEIRNPLNGVVGICAMLADREVGPREKMLVRTLGGCADQLRSMLDDILDFSRIDRGDVTLANVDFEICALVEESTLVMDPDRTACTLILPDQPVWLHGDSGKMRQIVCNLISNALKYGVPREAGIEVRAENAGGGRTRLRLAVRNSGPTIPAEEIPRLFDSFKRGSRTAGMPGSGLGLAVCRRLIQVMGGRITAASVDGVTEFAIEVVLANARPPEASKAPPAAVSRALAIEDEDYNRIALGHVLRALGYEVDWAADGTAALRLASEKQYDLVLTDWRLPDINGGDLTRRLLALLPEPKPPVVAITAYSTRDKLQEAYAAGMSGFITKPVTKEKLERVIRGLSEGLQPRRSLDTNPSPAAPSALASLGDLAPSSEQLARDISLRWKSAATMAELRDPRTAREAHALRSLLLLASEETAAEQVGLLEAAADANDWPTVDRLLPFAAEEIAATRARLIA